MLWMKGWLETRWRFLYALGLPLAALALTTRGGLSSPAATHTNMGVLSFFLIFAGIYLAGAGIRTQPAFQMAKGLHESTYFTLSLPVSRLRLLAVRSALGLLETAGISAVVIAWAWILFPPLRTNSGVSDLLQSILAAIVCIACIHFFAVLLASFLEDIWCTLGGILAVGLLWWGTSRLSLPPSFDVFAFLTAASPLRTHALPWPAMGISLLLSAVLFLAAYKVVQAREY
jgi:hypothetical protein